MKNYSKMGIFSNKNIKEMESRLPPGFRFYPTEEELVGYYLRKKVASEKIELDVIADIDLYRIEPWDLQGRCWLGYTEEKEWYFFSHKDKKYPTGTRTNRATATGFWKATGRDKAVLFKQKIIGMRKTLVFYRGRAPNGCKTDYIIHEYRLQSSPQEEGWVVCRLFKKQSPHPRRIINPWNSSCYELQAWPSQQLAFAHSSGDFSQHTFGYNHEPEEPKQTHLNQMLELPQLNSPSLSTSLVGKEGFEPNVAAKDDQNDVDWNAIDELLASQHTDPTSSSNISLPIIPLDGEIDVLNQENHFLGSFDDS